MSRCVNLETKYKSSLGRSSHITNLADRIKGAKKHHYDRNLPLRDHDIAFYKVCDRIYERIKKQEESDEAFFQDITNNQDDPKKVESLCKQKLIESTILKASAPEWDKNAQHYEDLAVFLRAYGEVEGEQVQKVMDFVNKILDTQESNK